ncbi:MAG: hypothetical protein ACREOI_14295 [bacterium]
MKQKSRLFFITSWLVLRLRWSLAFLRLPVSPATLERLWSQPGIILFSRQHRPFLLDRWCFDEQHGAYLYSSEPEEPVRVHRLPEISRN